MDAVAFKKKSKKKSTTVGARKRKLSDGGDEDVSASADGDTGADTLRSIEEVLEEQRLRAQLLKEELKRSKQRLKADKEKAVNGGGNTGASTEMQYGLHDPKKDGAAGEKLLTLLDGQFTGQTGATAKEQHEELMNKYIEERLRKRAKPEEQEAKPAPVTTDDVLFADLREQVMAPTEESSDGGVLVWNTGIAEVELPSSYQERTLAATKEALESAQQRSRSTTTGGVTIDSSALPTNFSTDFSRHRSEHVAEMKSLSRDEQRERGFVAANKFQSNDDAAVARFRKMESRKRHR
ncbi:hypothetical protein PINS_up014458 [Pythium insidiosum]|nr:hypothetical protein PINS_up014458 [Pythium insidiosum]